MFRKRIFNPARGQAEDRPAASSRVGPWRFLSRRARSWPGALQQLGGAPKGKGGLRITPERSLARPQTLLTFIPSLHPCIPPYGIHLCTSSHLPAPLSLYSFLAKLKLYGAPVIHFSVNFHFSFSKLFKMSLFSPELAHFCNINSNCIILRLQPPAVSGRRLILRS